MPPDRRAALVAWASVAVMAAGVTWAFLQRAVGSALWMVPATAVLVLWATLERAEPGTRGEPRRRSVLVFLRYFLAWVALSIASLVWLQALAASEGAGQAWASRAPGLIIALGLVVFGNALPTLTAPLRAGRDSGWQRARRFVGWTLVLAGGAIGASWISLDPDEASRATNGLLALCFFLVCARQVAPLEVRPTNAAPR